MSLKFIAILLSVNEIMNQMPNH